jgi:hypothetical protein
MLLMGILLSETIGMTGENLLEMHSRGMRVIIGISIEDDEGDIC